MAPDMMRPGTLAASGPRKCAASGETCTLEYSRHHRDPQQLGPGGLRAVAILSAWDALPIGEAEIFADYVISDVCAGPPLPPLTTMQAEADAWATFASTRELKTYIAAAVARLTAKDRTALAEYLGRLV